MIKKPRYIKSPTIKALEELAFQVKRERFPGFPYPVKDKYKDNTSNGLTKRVIDYINLSGYQAERINSTGRVIDNTQTITDSIGFSRKIGSKKWIPGTGRTGTSDIHSVIKGQSVKIEIKCKATGDNYQSKKQKEYQKEVERAGGIYLLVRDFESFYNWFNEFVKS